MCAGPRKDIVTAVHYLLEVSVELRHVDDVVAPELSLIMLDEAPAGLRPAVDEEGSQDAGVDLGAYELGKDPPLDKGYDSTEVLCEV